MQKARIALAGVKEALGVYGFSVDQTLDSVKPEVVTNDGKTANGQGQLHAARHAADDDDRHGQCRRPLVRQANDRAS